MGKIQLFDLGRRGVNVVSDPLHLDDSELLKAQNAEVSNDGGEGALSQRPGMSRVNSTALDGTVALAFDVPLTTQSDYTESLYAGMSDAATHNWRTSLDGATWANNDEIPKPFGVFTGAAYFKDWPKAVSLDNKLYYFDNQTPAVLWEYDGVAEVSLGPIPSVSTAVGNIASVNIQMTTVGPDAASAVNVGVAGSVVRIYRFKPVDAGGNTGGYSLFGVSISNNTLDASNYVAINPFGLPLANATSYEVWRTSITGGAPTNANTIGLIGTITITAGAFTTGNGSGGAEVFTDKGLVGNSVAFSEAPSGGAATTYTYSVVAMRGASISTATTGSTTVGPTAIHTFFYPQIVWSSAAFASSYGIYRTVGGPTQGKIATQSANSLFDINATVALTGDGSAVPSPVVGAGVVGVTDFITDGQNLYFSILEANITEPNLPGRVFLINPKAKTFVQVGTEFSTNGAPSALAVHNGELWAGTYTGTTSARTPLIKKMPLTQVLSSTPDWGTDHTLTASLGSVASMIGFRGRLYVGVSSQVAGTAAIVKQRTEAGVWSTSRTGPATTVQNAYTSLWVHNNELYAGWTDAGTTAAQIDKFDGTTWVVDETFATTSVVMQAVTFNTELYIVFGKTSAAGNTTSTIKKRDIAGVWSTVDDESDHYRGLLGKLGVLA